MHDDGRASLFCFLEAPMPLLRLLRRAGLSVVRETVFYADVFRGNFEFWLQVAAERQRLQDEQYLRAARR